MIVSLRMGRLALSVSCEDCRFCRKYLSRLKEFLTISVIFNLVAALEDDSNGIAGSGTARTIENIQKYLPDNPRTIQVNEIKRVTKNFNCKSACDARTYEYLLPTFTFQKVLKHIDHMINEHY